VLVDFLARARGHRRERGSLTVEFALVVPVLIAIMFGIIDIGRFAATRTMLSQSAAIGARAACLGNATTTTVNDAVRDSAPGVVEWDGWEAIDEHERGLGEPAGRPRVKLVRLAELFEAGRRGAGVSEGGR